jgi:hypothetical protein
VALDMKVKAGREPLTGWSRVADVVLNNLRGDQPEQARARLCDAAAR